MAWAFSLAKQGYLIPSLALDGIQDYYLIGEEMWKEKWRYDYATLFQSIKLDDYKFIAPQFSSLPHELIDIVQYYYIYPKIKNGLIGFFQTYTRGLSCACECIDRNCDIVYDIMFNKSNLSDHYRLCYRTSSCNVLG